MKEDKKDTVVTKCIVPWCVSKPYKKVTTPLCFRHFEETQFILWLLPQVKVEQRKTSDIVLPDQHHGIVLPK